MKDDQGAPVLGHTQWKRFGLALIPTVAVVVGLGLATANGALGVSFAISGEQAKVSADTLKGTGFVQYGGFDKTTSGGVPVAVSGIKSADLTNLCQSVVETIPIVNVKVTLRLTAPTAHADDLVIDMNQLNGDATFGHINIGQDASTLQGGPTGAEGQAGFFGQQAETVTINHLRQVSYATTAGTFTLNGLSLKLDSGDASCFPGP